MSALEQRFIALIERFIDFIIRRYRLVLAVMLILTLPMLYFYSQKRHYNHIDIYFDSDNHDLLYYREFQKKFGNEELVFIVFKDREIFTRENIDLVRKVSDEVGRVPGVQRVLSLTEAKEAVGDAESVSFKHYFPKDGVLSDEHIRAARGKMLAEPVLLNNLISRDGATTAIVAEIESLKEEQKRATIDSVMKAAGKAAGARAGELRYAGVPIAESRMNSLSTRDFNTFTPITLILIFVLVAFTLRNLTLSLLTMANMLIILVWGIGFFVLSGETFNMLTVAMGPMLLTSAVESSVHTLSEFEEDYLAEDGRKNYAALVRKTIGMVLAPCFLTSLTTSMGFMSFGPANVQPVQTLGIYTAITVMMAFVITMIFMPVMLMVLEKRFHAKIKWEGHRGKEDGGLIVRILTAMVRFDLRHYRLIAFGTIAVLVASTVVGIANLRFETNTMRYLLDSDRTKQDIQFIESNLGGAIPLAVVVRAKSPEHDFNNPASLRMIDEIQRHLMKRYEARFTSSFSIADYFKQIHRAFNSNDPRHYTIPASRRDIADFYEIGDAEVLDRMISADRMEARISLQSKWGSNEEARIVNREIQEYMRTELGNHHTYRLTGLSTLYVKMEQNLMTTQIWSFSLSLIMIFAMMFLVCRNFSLTIISMLPNVFPIFITLGLMGLLKMPFDVATIMIGSIALGIVVDDTTHYMVWFRRNMMAGMSHADAIVQTFRDVGRPTFIISIVLCFGFGVLVLGSMKPTINFGLLSAFTLLIAPLGDYLMLPALILLLKPNVKR